MKINGYAYDSLISSRDNELDLSAAKIFFYQIFTEDSFVTARAGNMVIECFSSFCCSLFEI